VAGGAGVIIDTSGHLGTVVSSERFKAEIKPMDKASEEILGLKPVTFRYKHELDPSARQSLALPNDVSVLKRPRRVASPNKRKRQTRIWRAVFELSNE
jgi:hypothetical protein